MQQLILRVEVARRKRLKQARKQTSGKALCAVKQPPSNTIHNETTNACFAAAAAEWQYCSRFHSGHWLGDDAEGRGKTWVLFKQKTNKKQASLYKGLGAQKQGLHHLQLAADVWHLKQTQGEERRSGWQVTRGETSRNVRAIDAAPLCCKSPFLATSCEALKCGRRGCQHCGRNLHKTDAGLKQHRLASTARCQNTTAVYITSSYCRRGSNIANTHINEKTFNESDHWKRHYWVFFRSALP